MTIGAAEMVLFRGAEVSVALEYSEGGMATHAMAVRRDRRRGKGEGEERDGRKVEEEKRRTVSTWTVGSWVPLGQVRAAGAAYYDEIGTRRRQATKIPPSPKLGTLSSGEAFFLLPRQRPLDDSHSPDLSILSPRF